MRAATYFSRRAVRPRACASTRAFTWRTTTAHRRSPQSGASRHDRSPWIVAEHSAPEPWTLALLTLGLVALFVARASMSPRRADQYSCELLEEARSRRRADTSSFISATSTFRVVVNSSGRGSGADARMAAEPMT